MLFTNWDGEPDLAEVWSPGPRPQSVWTVDGRVVRKIKGEWREVHPPSVAEEAAAESKSFKLTARMAEYVVRSRYRHAPSLSAGAWLEARGYIVAEIESE